MSSVQILSRIERTASILSQGKRHVSTRSGETISYVSDSDFRRMFAKMLEASAGLTKKQQAELISRLRA